MVDMISAIYTIYFNPSDFPGDFVVKKWDLTVEPMRQDLNFLKLARTIEAARQYIPAGMRNIGREPDDDPVIFECWM